jgi:hypothetical protein
MVRMWQSWTPMVMRMFAGVLLGLPVALFAGILGRWLGALRMAPGGWGDLIGGIAGGAGGYLIGVAIGAGWAGGRHRRVSMVIALLGGALGGFAALVAVALLGAARSPGGLLIPFLLAVPVAADGALRVTIDRRRSGASSHER